MSDFKENLKKHMSIRNVALLENKVEVIPNNKSASTTPSVLETNSIPIEAKNLQPKNLKGKYFGDLQAIQELNINTKQVEVYEKLQKMHLAKVAFWVCIVLIGIGVILLAACIISVLFLNAPLINVSLGIAAFNTVLSTAFYRVLSHFYPTTSFLWWKKKEADVAK